MPRIALAKKKTFKNCPSCFATKEEGFWAHQMCESMTIPIKPTFTHSLQIN
jgi:hypothetical protein